MKYSIARESGRGAWWCHSTHFVLSDFTRNKAHGNWSALNNRCQTCVWHSASNLYCDLTVHILQSSTFISNQCSKFILRTFKIITYQERGYSKIYILLPKMTITVVRPWKQWIEPGMHCELVDVRILDWLNHWWFFLLLVSNPCRKVIK